MRDRTVNVNPRRYELVPSGESGSHGGPTYDVYFASTPNVAGTPLKADVLLADSVALKYGLNTAKTNETLYLDPDFPHPSNAFRDVWKYIYPVGSIFSTVNPNFATPAAVGNWFGGTWARWGEGKVTFAYSTTDTDFGIASTGGFKGIQQHTHALNHNHTVNTSGDLTSNNNTLGLGTSTQADHTHTTPNHTHTPAGTTVSVNIETSHTHSFSDTSSSNGGHDHLFYYSSDYFGNDGSQTSIYKPATSGSSSYEFTGAVGDHTHSVSGTTGTGTDHTHTTDSHTHTIPSSGGGTSGSAGTHSHTISAHSHVVPTHAHTMAVGNFTSDINTSAAGANSAATNGNLPPYVVCYQYVRTA